MTGRHARGRAGRNRALRADPLPAALGAAAAGCSDRATIASRTVPAPGGDAVVSIETVRFGGPGTAALVTTVGLAVGGDGRSADVLTVAQPDDRPGHVRARRTDPTHLTPILRRAIVAFRAIRYAGIAIDTVLPN